ncbi:MAG: hypothetical protein ACYTG5_02165 [Planctomycetota bacterium]|jgi:hypothetical protein
MRSSCLTVLPLFCLLACHHKSHDDDYVVVAPVPELPRPVAIEVEVYDPITGYVWEDMGVRIVEAEVEATGCYCLSPYPDDWYFSDAYGLVYFNPLDIAYADVGFVENAYQEAVLLPELHGDEALVVLEVWAPGFLPVELEVYLDWTQPEVFLSVAIESLPLE